MHSHAEHGNELTHWFDTESTHINFKLINNEDSTVGII